MIKRDVIRHGMIRYDVIRCDGATCDVVKLSMIGRDMKIQYLIKMLCYETDFDKIRVYVGGSA